MAEDMSWESAQEPRTSQHYKLNKTLTEKDMQFSLLENSIKSKEKKNKLKKKESEPHKTDDTPQWGAENLPHGCEERQDTSKTQDSSGKSSSSKKKKQERNRTAVESAENCPPKEMNDDKHAHQIPEPLEPPVKVKKSKKKKQLASPSWIELQRSAVENTSGGKFQKSSNKETTTDLKCKTSPRNDEGTSQRKTKHPLSLHQSNIPVYTSTPLSSSNVPAKRDPKRNGPDKTKEMSSASDLSQDLFITQKKFVSSHSSSGDSPPLGQLQGSGVRDWSRTQTPHQLTQFSCLTRNSNESNPQEVLKEKATQTDNSFSYLALMSFVKKVKVLEPCLEEPLDLSLPSRIRAKTDGTSQSNDVVILESQSTPANPRKSKIRFRLTPLQMADQSKFVQTVLNSSFFFKGKGVPGKDKAIPPILKMKETPKKKSRKSSPYAKKRP